MEEKQSKKEDKKAIDLAKPFISVKELFSICDYPFPCSAVYNLMITSEACY